MNSSVSKPDVPKPEVSKPDVPKPDVSNKTSNDVPGLKTVYGTTNCPTYTVEFSVAPAVLQLIN